MLTFWPPGLSRNAKEYITNSWKVWIHMHVPLDLSRLSKNGLRVFRL